MLVTPAPCYDGEAIAPALDERGFVVVEDALPREQASALKARLPEIACR